MCLNCVLCFLSSDWMFYGFLHFKLCPLRSDVHLLLHYSCKLLRYEGILFKLLLISNRYDGSYTYHNCYQQYGFHRDTAVNVAGLGSCLLLISLGEFFLALASSIYCCTAVCCGTSPAVVSTVSNYHLHHSVVNVKS